MHLMPAYGTSAKSQSGARVFIAIAGFIFLGFNAKSFLEQYLLKHTSQTAQATTLRTEAVRRKGGVAYNVDYEFSLNNHTFQGTGLVTEKTFDNLYPGRPIDVHYVASNPRINETAEMSHNNAGMFLVMALGVPVSLGMIFFPLLKKHDTTPITPVDSAPLPAPKPMGPLPPMIEGIAFTVYPVRDMTRARAFYEQVLGLKAARDFRGEWIEYHLWDNCFAITTMMTGVEPGKDGGKIGLEVNDVDRFVSELRAKGVTIKIEPFSTPGCRMAVVLDPEGNGLTLHHKIN